MGQKWAALEKLMFNQGFPEKRYKTDYKVVSLYY